LEVHGSKEHAAGTNKREGKSLTLSHQWLAKLHVERGY